MTSYERVKAMVEGKPVDRPGVAVWKHFFMEDRNVTDSFKVHEAFENQNNWDVIKMMNNAIYFQEQYGAEFIPSRTRTEFPIVTKRVVNTPVDFRRLKPVNVKTGAVAREVETAKRLVDRFGGKVPVLATVFTPTSYAQELMCGNFQQWPFRGVLLNYQEDLKEGLKIITDVTQKIIEEFVNAGVDGIFYASQHMHGKIFTKELYEEFCKPYELEAFQPAIGRTWFNMLHVHGRSDIFMEEAAGYPQQAINWEDINTGVTIAEVHKMYPDKILMAGIERYTEFEVADRDQLLKNLVKRVKDAAAQAPANKLIIATGCSQPEGIPDYRFNVLRDAMDIVFGKDK